MGELLGSLQDRTFARATAATASSYPAQRPHAAMSSYMRRDVTFWLPTMAGSIRERNLRGTPWLTMVIATFLVLGADPPASEDGQRYFELSRPFLSHASPGTQPGRMP